MNSRLRIRKHVEHAGVALLCHEMCPSRPFAKPTQPPGHTPRPTNAHFPRHEPPTIQTTNQPMRAMHGICLCVLAVAGLVWMHTRVGDVLLKAKTSWGAAVFAAGACGYTVSLTTVPPRFLVLDLLISRLNALDVHVRPMEVCLSQFIHVDGAEVSLQSCGPRQEAGGRGVGGEHGGTQEGGNGCGGAV